MITLTCFPVVGGVHFAEFEIKSLKQGLDFILYSLESLSVQEGDGVSIAIRERGNQVFPSIHFQQVADKCFFQIYVDEELCTIGEGWHCFVEGGFEQSGDGLVSTIWDESDFQERYFQARFSDGVLFSKSLLAPKNLIKEFIDKHQEDFELWYEQGSWSNLGLI